MSVRNIPVVATIVVVAAAAVMAALGFWQLGRLEQKEAMIEQYSLNAADTRTVDIARGNEEMVYRRVSVECPDPADWRAIAGRNVQGQTGYVHQYTCAQREAGGADGGSDLPATFAVIGWSQAPQEPVFTGGTITGTLISSGDDFKVVAEPPLADLQANAAPDPNDLPNNHLAYAGQWFFFSLTALVIYAFALRRRAREQA